MYQLSFIEEPREITLEREIKNLKEQAEKTRKAQFAKIGALTKVINELDHELKMVSSAICKGHPVGQPSLFRD